MACHPAGVENLTGEKPTPVITQPSESPHIVVPVLSERPVRPAPSDQRDEWDILKAIVYGGLVESITSLSVCISNSAAASGAKTRISFFLGSCIVFLSYFETQVKTVFDLAPLVLM